MNGVARRAPISAAAIATIVHGTTVGTNALLERKVARTGIITTRGFPRRARDAPPRPAARPGACAAASRRSCRAICASKSTSACWPTARCTRRSTSTRCARRRARCSKPAARRSACSSSTPTPTRRTSALAVAAVREIWPNAARHVGQRECCPRSASSSAARRPRSTPRLQPVVGSYLERLESDLRGARLRRRAAGRAEQRRRDVASDRERPAGAHRAVGPGGGRDRLRAPSRARRAFRTSITGDMGGTCVRRLAGRRRRSRAGGADRDRVRHGRSARR